MCRVKVIENEDGLIPSERVVKIRTKDGSTEELAVSDSLLKNESLRAAFIGRDTQNSRVLIELPTESTSGRRRVWVEETEVVEA